MLKQRRVKFVLGITGNIACGKSTVARMFKTKDSLLIDADACANLLLAKNRGVYKKIKGAFGRGVLKRDNCIDRKKLAKIVFADKKALNKLSSIVHPLLIREIKRRIKNSDKKIIILDAALIIEAGLKKMVDRLVVVKAKKEQQILRKIQKRGFTKEDIVMRMKFQIPQNKKLRFADFIIDNSGKVGKTRKQVFEIRKTLIRLADKGFLDKTIRRKLWKS